MPALEYRLLDEEEEYPVLYHYVDIDKGEIAARFACNRFIKQGAVYEKTSCAVEPLTYVIYVNDAGEVPISPPEAPQGVGVKMELRKEKTIDPLCTLLETYHFQSNEDLLLYLQADYVVWLGEEWEKTAAVIDEDRKVYALYVQPGGV